MFGHLQIPKGTDSVAHPGIQGQRCTKDELRLWEFFVSRKHKEEKMVGGLQGLWHLCVMAYHLTLN